MSTYERISAVLKCHPALADKLLEVLSSCLPVIAVPDPDVVSQFQFAFVPSIAVNVAHYPRRAQPDCRYCF